MKADTRLTLGMPFRLHEASELASGAIGPEP